MGKYGGNLGNYGGYLGKYGSNLGKYGCRVDIIKKWSLLQNITIVS